ncbi:MAG: TonB-dependent receptor [Acidobacteriota bacterium]
MPAAAGQGDEELRDLSLEQLLDLEVTSLMKVQEPAFQVPAAVHVLTAEDIRRSGVRTLPELLRMVPGLHVARVDSSRWAVSARGFNRENSNKLLVLIDGRDIYTPILSGVFWDVQGLLLEDIERIEVSRSPGGTLWGANAVNGVVNIVTKSAFETVDSLLTIASGAEEQLFTEVRLTGGKGSSAWRVFAQGFDREGFVDRDGAFAGDRWRGLRGGFRWDRSFARGSLTVQGDVFDTTAEGQVQIATPEPPFQRLLPDGNKADGGYLLTRGERNLTGGSRLEARLYYDRNRRTNPTSTATHDQFDIEVQHSGPASRRHRWVWGAGYRSSDDDLDGSFVYSLDPERRRTEIFSAFAQDRWALIPERLVLTAGTKLEHHDLSGFEVQPSLRLAWFPSPQQTLWGGVSRAVRTPNRTDYDGHFTFSVQPTNPPTYVSFFGDRDLDPESVVAWEVGHRIRPSSGLSFDSTVFFNRYRDLVSYRVGTPFFDTPPPRITVPIVPLNGSEAEAWGFELSVEWRPIERLQLQGSYSFLDVDIEITSPPAERLIEGGSSPRHQAGVRSFLDLPGGLQLDAFLYWVDRLESLAVPSYFRTDLRLAWPLSPDLELFAVVENATDDQHLEFISNTASPVLTEIERAFSVGATWRF